MSNTNLVNKSKLEDLKTSLTKEGHVEEKDGDMSYVANDFMEKLKMGGEKSSNQQRKTTDIPKINPHLLDVLEKDCIKLSDSVDAVMKELTKSLHKISAISVANTQACASKVADVDCVVDAAVRNMYSLIAHCEELDNSMKPVYKLADKISNLKEIVSTLETYIH